MTQDDDTLRPVVRDSLARIGREIDRGRINMTWTQALHILALAKWAVDHGFCSLAELDSLIPSRNENEDEA